MFNFPIHQRKSGDMWGQYVMSQKVYGLVQYACETTEQMVYWILIYHVQHKY